MVILSGNPDDIPSMAVLDPFFRVAARKYYDAPDPQCVAQNLYCLGNAFTDSDTLSQRTDNFVIA